MDCKNKRMLCVTENGVPVCKLGFTDVTQIADLIKPYIGKVYELLECDGITNKVVDTGIIKQDFVATFCEKSDDSSLINITFNAKDVLDLLAYCGFEATTSNLHKFLESNGCEGVEYALREAATDCFSTAFSNACCKHNE